MFAETTPLQQHLSRYRGITLDGLLSSLPAREPRRYLYDPLTAHLSRVGKSIRPAICLATCVAFGGKEDDALQSALALEMLHNAFLVHDDVEDESELRRGTPTMHAEHGVPLAVNAGDTLNALSLRLFRNNLSGIRTKTYVARFRGSRSSDVGVPRRPSNGARLDSRSAIRCHRARLSQDDIEKDVLVQLYSSLPYWGVDRYRDSVDLDRFNLFGFYLGAAFQIQDDLLNLVGEQEKYGKEIGGDLLEGKRTLMLVHLLRHSETRVAERVQAFLREPRRNRYSVEVNWIIGQMQQYGSIDYARSVLRHMAGAALYEFNHAFGGIESSDEKTFIQNLINYVASRDL